MSADDPKSAPRRSFIAGEPDPLPDGTLPKAAPTTVAELLEMALFSGDDIQLVNCVIEHQSVLLAALRAVEAVRAFPATPVPPRDYTKQYECGYSDAVKELQRVVFGETARANPICQLGCPLEESLRTVLGRE